jgi:TMEM175 potassium channel family protein
MLPVTEPSEDRVAGSPERFVTFTDAVVAIALTLLILPLLETISEFAGEEPLGTLFHEHVAQLGAFVLSYAVIFQLWWSHHRMFRHVARLNRTIVRWSEIWTFAIVFMPISTAITAQYRPSPATVGLYGGTLLLASASMTMLALTVRRHPELNSAESPATADHVMTSAAAFFAMLIAAVVGSVFADRVNYWAFLLLFLTGPIERLVKRRRPRSA